MPQFHKLGYFLIILLIGLGDKHIDVGLGLGGIRVVLEYCCCGINSGTLKEGVIDDRGAALAICRCGLGGVNWSDLDFRGAFIDIARGGSDDIFGLQFHKFRLYKNVNGASLVRRVVGNDDILTVNSIER